MGLRFMTRLPILVGGLGVVADENVIMNSRRRITCEPKGTDDTTTSTVWITVIIDHTN